MPTSVPNFDIAGAADRIVTFANVILASQSARQAEFNEHDRKRATANLDRLESYVEVISNPANPLDLPKTHPSAYPIAEFPTDEEINVIENAEVRDLVRRFKAAHVELVNSQSKDRATGIRGQLEVQQVQSNVVQKHSCALTPMRNCQKNGRRLTGIISARYVLYRILPHRTNESARWRFDFSLRRDGVVPGAGDIVKIVRKAVHCSGDRGDLSFLCK